MKFFKWLGIILLGIGLVYYIYRSFLIIPLHKCFVVYYKFPGKLVCYKDHGFKINFFRGLPKNAAIKQFPSDEQRYNYTYDKKVRLFDKEVTILKYSIMLTYQLNLNQYQEIYRQFASQRELTSFLEQEISDYLNEELNTVMQKNVNLNGYNKVFEKEVINWLKIKYEKSYIDIKDLSIVNLHIIPDFNYKRLSELLEQALAYEESFKLELRKIELDKLKMEKQAENEVVYLNIIGEYIQKNPLILRYMLINKLNQNSVVVVPSHDSDIDFSRTFKEKAIDKLMEKKIE